MSATCVDKAILDLCPKPGLKEQERKLSASLDGPAKHHANISRDNRGVGVYN